ncbi:hypothetical protein [Desulfatirhabdium butyrativorans]|uniref:hypothetical protein n=1 Tax=Desulfatirhabdium butyrativorans TaxID=340467 RepID=UPI0012EC164F|nr:hypothetical protein [Desulfatirhabdium butyrativorans]
MPLLAKQGITVAAIVVVAVIVVVVVVVVVIVFSRTRHPGENLPPAEGVQILCNSRSHETGFLATWQESLSLS